MQSIFDIWDCVVIGAGPAGLAAAQALDQAGASFIIVDPSPGGWPAALQWVAPGEQAPAWQSLKAAYDKELKRVWQKVATHVEPDASGALAVHCSAGRIAAKAVIVAAGSRPRDLGLKESARIIIGPLQRAWAQDYQGRSVAIVGGGDNAFEYALIAAGRLAAKVDIWVRGIRAKPEFQAKAAQLGVTIRPACDPRHIVDTFRAVMIGPHQYDLCLVMAGFERKTLPAIDHSASGWVWLAGDFAANASLSLQSAQQSGRAAAEQVLEALQLAAPGGRLRNA